ncbi:MAG: S24 family peptidase, partial [Chromatiaceae bacterium]
MRCREITTPTDTTPPPALPDLRRLISQAPTATSHRPATGHSMTGVGILDGDLLVVDRAREPRHGHVVVAVID